jgi:hypothetical protein
VGPTIWGSGPEIDITLRDTVMSTSEVSVTGVVDTGASCVLLDQSVLFQLGLSPIDRTSIQVADGTQRPALGFMVQLKVPGLRFDQWFKVFGVKMQHPSTRVLLGRTFLAGYHVTYSGPDQWFHWSAAGPAVYEDNDG